MDIIEPGPEGHGFKSLPLARFKKKKHISAYDSMNLISWLLQVLNGYKDFKNTLRRGFGLLQWKYFLFTEVQEIHALLRVYFGHV